MKRKILFGLIIAASIVGVIASGYSTAAHFDADLYGVCDINDTFNCDVVNQSKYALFFGIPVAIMGLAAYMYFLAASIAWHVTQDRRIVEYSTLIAIMGLAFSLYLTSMEAFVIHAWCLFCIASQLAILVIAGSWLVLKRDLERAEGDIKQIHQ